MESSCVTEVVFVWQMYVCSRLCGLSFRCWYVCRLCVSGTCDLWMSLWCQGCCFCPTLCGLTAGGLLPPGGCSLSVRMSSGRTWFSGRATGYQARKHLCVTCQVEDWQSTRSVLHLLICPVLGAWDGDIHKNTAFHIHVVLCVT